MARQMLDEGAMTSLSMFYKIWQDDFPHVVIPEVCFYSSVYYYICFYRTTGLQSAISALN